MTEIDLYKKLLTIRLLEERLQELCYLGEAGDLHFNKGQEAISVGVCAALNQNDYIVTHHRTIAHAIAKGMPLKPLVAELLGKATGINGGVAGEMHFTYPEVRYMFTFQLVGTCLPVAAGLAWAVKNYLNEPSIVACFFGDATSSNAQAHEGLSIASVRKAPLLLICENNGVAGNIRKEFYLPTKTVAERAAGYGVKSCTIDGNRLPLIIETVTEAAKYVRENSRPYLIEMDTTRLSWHKQGMPDARSKEELSELAKRDPLSYEESRLNIQTSLKQELTKSISAEIEAAIESARAAPFPEIRVMD